MHKYDLQTMFNIIILFKIYYFNQYLLNFEYNEFYLIVI